MRIYSPKALKQFAARHPSAAKSLEAWRRITEHAAWANLHEVRRDYPHADAVAVQSGRTATVFNIGGNKFRLVTAIHYNLGRVFVLRIFTHSEYDRLPWTEQL